jgi:FMN-dependent NADH-azoreductase
VPEFDAAAVEGKMNTFAGIELDGPAVSAWRGVTAAFERFAAADEYLFSVPMWNASVPYKLKQLIDVVSQPSMVFSFDPTDGYTGLLTGRKAAVLYTGAIYGEGRGPAFGSDFQAPFFRDWLQWAGVLEVREIAFHPNIATADPAHCARSLARRPVSWPRPSETSVRAVTDPSGPPDERRRRRPAGRRLVSSKMGARGGS